MPSFSPNATKKIYYVGFPTGTFAQRRTQNFPQPFPTFSPISISDFFHCGLFRAHSDKTPLHRHHHHHHRLDSSSTLTCPKKTRRRPGKAPMKMTARASTPVGIWSDMAETQSNHIGHDRQRWPSILSSTTRRVEKAVSCTATDRASICCPIFQVLNRTVRLFSEFIVIYFLVCRRLSDFPISRFPTNNSLCFFSLFSFLDFIQRVVVTLTWKVCTIMVRDAVFGGCIVYLQPRRFR